MATVQPPNKACHNCRRQRLRCDRSHPSCNKCVLAGRECLGYGQLFRWTGAVASRGRFAGKTSTADAAPYAGAASKARDDDDNYEDEKKDSRAVAKTWTLKSGTKVGRGRNEEMEMVHTDGMSSPWVLTDPLFQDMGRPYRYYLSYFATRVCKDLVSYDLPDSNPFRTLLPLTSRQPLLQHILVAASAAHMSVLLRAPVPTSFRSDAQDLLDSGTSPPNEGSRAEVITPSTAAAAETALRDSLIAKQKALQLMQYAVQNVESVGTDVVLAAALFFVNVELIDSGRHGWRAHLEGAGRVMAMLPLGEHGNDTGMSALRSYLLSDCFIYYILASTISPISSASSSFHPSRMPATLARAAANSYLCCPPEILYILYSASQVSAALAQGQMPPVDAAQEGAELLRQAQSFDVCGWAKEVHRRTEFRGIDVSSRIHTGSAHREAACLYIIQAIEGAAAAAASTPLSTQPPTAASTAASTAAFTPLSSSSLSSDCPSPSAFVSGGRSSPPSFGSAERIPPSPLTSDYLSRQIFHHLSYIRDEDPNFKATAWPTFIGAASTKDPGERAWIMERLRRLIFWCPWGFLYTAMETLEVIWGFDEDKRGWLQRLRDPEMNFLMV